MTGRDNTIDDCLREEISRMKGQHSPDGSSLFDSHEKGLPPVNGSSTNGQGAANDLTLSGRCTNGHSVGGQAVNGQAGSNGSLQSGEYTNGQSTNGETMDDFYDHCRPPIAICGIALRLPAGLKTPQQLWEFLLAKGDARGRVPNSRYNVAAFHDPGGKYGTVITEYGYFLDDDIGALDTSFFSMPQMEVERADPQQRLMLEVARECFEDAGETAWRGKRIGCYMGSLGEDWCEMSARETQNWGPYRYTGYGDFALSNRVSYEMDLQGPRFAYAGSLILLDSNYSQYDHSDSVLSLTCGPARSVCRNFTGRLRLRYCWRRKSDHDSRRNYKYDSPGRTIEGRFLQNVFG